MICMFDCPSAWFRLGVLRSLCWLRLLICGLLGVYSWFGVVSLVVCCYFVFGVVFVSLWFGGLVLLLVALVVVVCCIAID